MTKTDALMAALLISLSRLFPRNSSNWYDVGAAPPLLTTCACATTSPCRYHERLRPLSPSRRKLSVQIWSHGATAAAGLGEGDFVPMDRVLELKRMWGGAFPAQKALDPVPGRDGW